MLGVCAKLQGVILVHKRGEATLVAIVGEVRARVIPFFISAAFIKILCHIFNAFTKLASHTSHLGKPSGNVPICNTL